MARFQCPGTGSAQQPVIKTSLDLRLWRVLGSDLQVTLEDAQTKYNYTDILDFHEYLNIRAYLEDLKVKSAQQEAASRVKK